jgi:hypothetical protein
MYLKNKNMKGNKKVCKSISKKLIFFVEKSLPDNEMSDIARHLQKCADCRLLTDKIKSTLQIIDNEKEIKANSFLHTKIFQQIENRKVVHENSLIYIINKVRQPVFYAAFIVLGIFAGTTISNIVIDTQYKKIAKIQEEEVYLNDFYQEPVESFLLTDNE